MKMTITEFKKWIKEAKTDEIKAKEPIDITSDGEVIHKFVPITWRDPRFQIH